MTERLEKARAELQRIRDEKTLAKEELREARLEAYGLEPGVTRVRCTESGETAVFMSFRDEYEGQDWVRVAKIRADGTVGKSRKTFFKWERADK
jgi:hypothetical protein